MVTSNMPLIEENSLSTTESDWQELLKLDVEPNMAYHIRGITIGLSTYRPTTETAIRVLFNGAPYLDEHYPVTADTTLGFGGDLVFDDKKDKALVIYVKSDGTTTLYATALVTGVKKPL